MPRLLRTVARTAVVAGTATAVSGRVSRRQAGRWAQQQPQAAAAPAAPTAASGTDPKIAQLQQLAEMRQQGMLTDAEFEVQKARILG